MRRGTVVLLAATSMTFGGMGNRTCSDLADIRREVPQGKVPSNMTGTPTFHSDPVVRTIAGYGYLSTDPGASDDLLMIFTYHRDHPYSVLIDISMINPYDQSVRDSTRWEVSRELLYDAVILGKASGVGDFQASALGVRRVRLRIMGSDARHEPQRRYDMYLSRGKLRAFLPSTTASVPVGRESDHLDIDGQLERMLS